MQRSKSSGRWDSDAFGVGAVNEDPDGDGQLTVMNLRFPGQYFDAETGQHYNYYRDYQPIIGRYIESDPIGLSAGVNTFGYVYKNPLGFFDPLGMVTCKWLGNDYHSRYEIFWQDRVLLRELSFHFVGPGDFAAQDCLPTLIPPRSRGRIPFPCSFPFAEWVDTFKLWEITSYLDDILLYSAVYKCEDECTGEVTFDRKPGKRLMGHETLYVRREFETDHYRLP